MSDEALGDLEPVRTFLNTWTIPNDGIRTPVDRLDDLRTDPARWQAALPGVSRPTRAETEELRELRTALREVSGQTHPAGLASWLSRHPLRPTLSADVDTPAVRLVPVRRTPVGQLLAGAVNAMSDGVWFRLRACPDCRYVFFDSSRNGSRTWCAMTRGDGTGRSCGNLAKARAKRARDRVTIAGSRG